MNSHYADKMEETIEALLPPDFQENRDRLNYLKNLIKELDLSFKIVHICGTNGKGSTASIISKILVNSGFNTGLFISPHIESIRERIQINGEKIQYEEFLDSLHSVRKYLRNKGYEIDETFVKFDLLFLTAIYYFQSQEVDYGVIEVGLGGAYDSTNTLDTVDYTIFTKIGLDHIHILGNSIEEIARTKAEIIRRGTRTIVAPNQDKRVIEVLEKVANSRGVNLKYASDRGITEKDGQVYIEDEKLGNFSFNSPKLGLYQLENIATALRWYGIFCRDQDCSCSQEVVIKSLEDLSIPGRFEKIYSKPNVIIDGAHNIDGINMFVKTIKKHYNDTDNIFIIGFLKDKTVEDCVATLFKLKGTFLITEPEDSNRKLPKEKLLDLAQQYSSNHLLKVYDTPIRALKDCLKCVNKNIFVVGSFELMKGLKQYLDDNKRI